MTNTKKLDTTVFNFTENEKNTLRLGVFASSGKGKSFLVSSMLLDEKLLKGKYDDIYLINPEYEFEPENSNWKKLKIDNIFLEFSQDLVETIINRTKRRFLRNRKYKSLLIMDDCVSDSNFSNKHRTELTKAFTNSRKTGLSIILISQRISLVPLTIHSQFNYIILFKTGFNKELKTIEDSYAFSNKNIWRQMLKLVFQKKRDFLLIDIDNERYFRNFNLLKITEERNEKK